MGSDATAHVPQTLHYLQLHQGERWWSGSSHGGMESHLLEVLAQSYAQGSIPVVEHLASHESVEGGRAGKGHAEIEAEIPPILGICIKLETQH